MSESIPQRKLAPPDGEFVPDDHVKCFDCRKIRPNARCEIHLSPTLTVDLCEDCAEKRGMVRVDDDWVDLRDVAG